MSSALLAAAALIQGVASSSDLAGASPWRAMTLTDLHAARAFLQAQDISAVYPDPARFARKLDAAAATADAEAAAVSSFPGYRAVLKRFVNTLDDEHAGVAFPISQTRLYWPGFVIHRVGGRYVTAASRRQDVADGRVVSACDGEPIDAVVARVALYEGGHPGLESTRVSAALLTLIDQANPFLKRLTTCVIDGREVKLAWDRIYYADYARTVLPLAGQPDETAKVTWVDGNVAWVRLGYFEPDNPAQAADFRAVVAQAPSLRNARAVVLDVRQNGGGPYDWMMAFLNSFYGKPYADAYARARLAIHPVYRATPEVLRMFRESDAADAAAQTPAAAAREEATNRGVDEAVAAGRPYFRPAFDPPPPPQGAPPLSPVRAQVVVLTDYGCASVCIGFVDELKRFPGVRQVGTDTFVDNRTGTPMTRPLPSGVASIYAPVMTRDGRLRGDNEPQHPDVLYAGDPADTAALRRWVLHDVLAKAAGGRS